MKLIGGVLVAAIATSGCSALFMERLPAGYDPFEQDAHCTGSKGFVAWDAALAIIHVGGMVAWGVLASNAEPDTSEDINRTKYIGGAAINGAFAIGHIVSAKKGNVWANNCRVQRAQREDIERKEAR